jgi:hypothetical protein
MTYQKLWDTAKAILRGKFKAMSAHIIRTERSQINDNTTTQTPTKKKKIPKQAEGKKYLNKD